MKQSLFAVCLLIVSLAASAQDYYWYRNEKIALEKGNQQYILYQDDLLSEADKDLLVRSEAVSIAALPNLMWGITKPDAVLADAEHVLYQIPSFRTEQSGEKSLFVTHRFYVKLKEAGDLTVLEEMAKQYNAEIEEQDSSLPLWYTLRWDLSCTKNALELANIFYESGHFQAAEPEFMGGVEFLDVEQVASGQSLSGKKILRNGQLYLMYKGAMYNVQGQELR